MKLALQILFLFLASANLLLSWFVLFRLHQPTTLPMWGIKVFTCASSPILFITGLLIAISGLFLHSLPVVAVGSSSALLYLIHIMRVTTAPEAATGIEKVFGANWESAIPAGRKAQFLKKRYVLRLPNSPEAIFNQNIPFHTIPSTSRQLLCDIWQPPKSVKHSGLAFIYLHGSAWAVLDKDCGTRTFFMHLASQGHVIMDVAYRLFPETDFMGMVHDAKHAIAWMKANAAAYDVRPDRIVIGGGSAGAHLSLLAAYTGRNDQLNPPELASSDLQVRGVVSLYGQADLTATYFHTCQHLAAHSALAQKKEGKSSGMPLWMQKRMGENFHRFGFDKNVEPGMLAPMLGGNPNEKPEAYALFSPITHAGNSCPSSLIVHGKHDILAPVKAIRELHAKLKEADVPVVMHLLPLTDHAFDLILPKISPSAQNCYYDVERFLALLV